MRIALPLMVFATCLFVAFAVTRWGWFVFFACVFQILGSIAMLAFDRVVVVAEGAYCRACGYDLAALPAGSACPECGGPRS